MNLLAKQQIENIFEHRFNKDNFSRFIINLLNEVEPNSSFEPLRGAYIKAPFQGGIQEYERVCKYIDEFENQVDVLIVKLKDKSKLENARTFQRNFVIDYLNGGRGGKLKDGALVAFYTDDSPDWRFSFVKLEYDLKEEKGKIKEEKKMTSARRYSFLVGENENSHTAQSQLLPLLEEEERNPTLKQIEKVFEVETVTKEFFEKYKDLFLRVNSKLEEIVLNDPEVRKDFESKDINTIDFTKKLLGQIVFLYFLQKKGWFGVPLNKKWGEGDKRFLRTLFEKSKVDNRNFFNDYLEPLFYEALAKERDDNYFSRFGCKIPFLNGGLFDPIGNYDWVNTNINISDDLFSNDYISQDKHKDKGTGILDVFDRYNFTVREDEPLEKEVAIDPEMLGKVFENMLEVKDRKSKGTYYTPREIVHYMCQESLINYLESHLKDKVTKDDLVYLVKKAEYDKEKEQAGIEGVKIYEINSEFPTNVKSSAIEIDNLLKDIKVCDPAIGSGAFPVGMMNEIVKVRTILSQFIEDKENRTEYAFKRFAIANSIHGVDIDQGAVEIAKLRLWLSLIVDEDEIENIKPLPNLDYKIMQGNSLLDEFEGIKLFNDNILKTNYSKNKEIEKLKERQNILQKKFFEIYNNRLKKLDASKIDQELRQVQKQLEELKKPQKEEKEQTYLFLSRDEAKEKSENLLKLQKRFFITSQKSEKENLKILIDDLIWDLIETTVKQEGKAEKLEHIRRLRKSNNKPFFLWKLNFVDVFKEKGGFDIVIANPPYVKEYTQKSAFDGLRDSKYYKGKMDLWYLFVCFGIDLLHEHGILTFIAQNNWITSYGALIMRNKVLNDTKILSLLDFGNYMIFDTADIQTMVMIFEKDNYADNYTFDYRKLKGTNLILNNALDLIDYKKTENTLFLHPIIETNKLQDKPLSFVNISEEKLLEKLLLRSIKLNENEIANGIHTHHDVITKSMLNHSNDTHKVGEGIFVLSEKEKFNLNLSRNELALIKPFYESDKLKGYYSDKNNVKWIIYTDSRFKNPKQILSYPNIKKHLDSYQDVITSDNKPYGLHRARNENFFKGEKIIALRKCSKRPVFTFTDFDCYVSATFYVIKTDRVNQKYLLSILNSRLIVFWLLRKGKMQGSNFQIDKEPLLEIPIKIATDVKQKQLVRIVEQIFSITRTNNYLDTESKLEQTKVLQIEIDRIVYKLYELTEEEIKIVEEETKHLYN